RSICPSSALSTAVPCLLLYRQATSPRAPHPFPTRRSSDLIADWGRFQPGLRCRRRSPSRSLQLALGKCHIHRPRQTRRRKLPKQDRKSTRLNSSHGSNSYAVFCLEKKKEKMKRKQVYDNEE